MGKKTILRHAEVWHEGALPQGYSYQFSPEDSRADVFHQDDPHTPASTLKWYPSGEIRNIWTGDQHQRKGLATELINQTKQRYPQLDHSEDLTPTGREFAKSMGFEPDPPDDSLDYEDNEGSHEWEVPHTVQHFLQNQETPDQQLERMKREWEDKFGPRKKSGILRHAERHEAMPTYYHVAPHPNKDSILQHGLDHTKGEHQWGETPGNYFWEHPDDAQEYADDMTQMAQDDAGAFNEAPGYTVMPFTHHGPVLDDPEGNHEQARGKSFYTPDPIPASAFHHEAQLRKKSGILRQREIDAIFREAAPVIGVMPQATAPELPDHDYLQHHLGDDEDWGIQRQVTAAELPPPHKDQWSPGETAHYEYHCLQSPESSDYHLWQHSHQPVKVLGLSPEAEDWSKDLPTLDQRRDEGTPNVYQVQFGDGLKGDAWEDELLTHPGHFSPQHAPPSGARTAAPATKLQPAQPVDMSSDLTYSKPAPGSSHGAEIHNGSDGSQWLVKKAPPQAPHMVDMDVAANRIASHSGLEAPATFKTTTPEGGTASAQLMYPGAKDAFPGSGPLDPEKLSSDDMATIQKHHALDWLLSNHDDHNRNFIRTQDGKLVGIDKGQAMKFFNNDRLHWDFFPNAHEPVHNTLYRNMAKGGRVLHDPRQGEVGQYIQGLQDIPDEEYQAMLLPYAQGAADQGELAKDFKASGYSPHHGGTNVMGDPRVKPNDVAMFLEAATQRKNNLMNDFGKLYDKALAHHETGSGIA